MTALRLLLAEYKKAMLSPITLSLLVLFVAFNLFLIYDRAYVREELTTANQLAKQYGIHMNDRTMAQLEKDLHLAADSMNAITAEKTSETYDSATDFFSQRGYRDEAQFTDEEWQFFQTLQLKEMYADIGQGIADSYEQLDMKQIGERTIEKYGLSGRATETLRGAYGKLSERFAELKQNGEHRELFFAGSPYRMHSFLFKDLFRTVIFEVTMLIVLCTAFIANYEFEHRTHLLVYATKRGRKVMRDKLAAALLTAVTVMTVILGATLTAYFTVFDYGSLSHSAISSAFNQEAPVPYVSWWPMSFLTFLLCSVALVYVVMLLFSAIAFVVSSFVRNSYFVFFIFGLLFGVGLLLPSFMPSSSNGLFAAGFNPFMLVMNPHYWFMGTNELLPFQYYEGVTVGVWAVIVILLGGYCMNRFKKQEIV